LAFGELYLRGGVVKGQRIVSEDWIRTSMVPRGRSRWNDREYGYGWWLRELGGRVSWLNPFWYAGAFGMGLLAGRTGDRTSLGFVVETERQVEQHLASHLDRLPVADAESRAVVAQMRDDEARHAQDAESAGAAELPAPVRWMMRGLAGVMTRTAHYV